MNRKGGFMIARENSPTIPHRRASTLRRKGKN